MQASEAAALRRQWNGSACEHTKLVAEYDQDNRTGDMVCVQCGKTFPHAETRNWKRQERSS